MAQQWYYSTGGAQQGPVPAETIRQGLAAGQIAPTDLVWTDGMANWVAASTVPEFSSGQAPPPAGAYGVPAAAYGQPQYQEPGPAAPINYQQPQQPFYGVPVEDNGKGLAIGGMVTSIVGVFGFCCPILSVVGLILGVVAKGKMDRTGNPDGRGLAIAAIIIGIVGIVIGIGYYALTFALMPR